MTLIKNWRDAWKFTSVQSALILATVSGLFYFMPVVQEYLSPALYALIMLVGNIAVTVLRLVAQPSLNGGNDA